MGSLTLFFLAASATDVRSASRRIATICSSVNRPFLMISSQSRSRFSRNYWYEETGQVNPTKIRQLIDDITEVDAATTSEAPDYGMNNLAVVLTSASGHRTTLTSGRKGSDSALALLSESRELGRFLEKSDALEYRIYAWIDQMPENDNDGFSSLCQGRAHRYLMDRFGKPDK